MAIEIPDLIARGIVVHKENTSGATASNN